MAFFTSGCQIVAVFYFFQYHIYPNVSEFQKHRESHLLVIKKVSMDCRVLLYGGWIFFQKLGLHIGELWKHWSPISPLENWVWRPHEQGVWTSGIYVGWQGTLWKKRRYVMVSWRAGRNRLVGFQDLVIQILVCLYHRDHKLLWILFATPLCVF